MTDRRKNITLLQTSFAGGNNNFKLQYIIAVRRCKFLPTWMSIGTFTGTLSITHDGSFGHLPGAGGHVFSCDSIENALIEIYDLYEQ